MLAFIAADRHLITAARLCACLGVALLVLPSAVWAFSPDMLPSAAIWTNFQRKIRADESVPISAGEDTDGDGVVDYQVFRHKDGAQIVVKKKPGPDGMIVDYVELREGKDKKNWVFGFNKADSPQNRLDMVVRGWFSKDKVDCWDQMLYDSDSDGRPDRFLYDLDKNGVYDCMGTDDNGDGKLDLLYDLDNKTGEVLNKTVGWVTFKEQQRKEGLPALVYSFEPELQTLSGATPIVVRATWDFGDGATRASDDLVPGEHIYPKAGTYAVSLDVEFKLTADGETYKAWQGVSLPVEAPPLGPAPLTAEAVTASINSFYGACGLVAADEQPKVGSVAELWPEVKLPEAAPAGRGLRSRSIAPGELDVAVFWWRSDAEAGAFLDALAAVNPKPELPVLATRAADAKPFAVANKIRAELAEKAGVRTTAWREGGFVVTLSTNRTVEEAQRWSRLLYDMLHPGTGVPAAPAGG